MRKQIKQFFINFTTFILSISLLLLLTEMGLRLFSRNKEYIPKRSINNIRQWRQADPLLGVKHIPGANGLDVTNEYSVIYRFNSKGIRGPEYSYHKPKGEFRILFLGDSFCMGVGVEFEDIFSEILKRKLNSKVPGGNQYFQTINTGVEGWCTGNELLFFDNEARKYNPNLTVLMVYENDIRHNNKPGYYPMRKLSNLLLSLTIPSSVTKEQKIIRNYPLNKLKTWAAENTYLYNYVKARVKRNRYLYTIAKKIHLAESPFISDDLLVWKKKCDEDCKAAWKMTEIILLKLRDEIKNINGELLIFYAPSSASIYEEKWQSTLKEYGISGQEWDINTPKTKLSNICRRNGIDFLDPTPLFSNKANELNNRGESLYYLEGHWNPAGHKAVAEALTEYIGSRYIENKTQK